MLIRIAARSSSLAKMQAYLVGAKLKEFSSDIEIQYFFRESLGDKNLNTPLWKIPDKGVFTEDFYQDLVSENVDLVVHSWKDLPTETKSETVIAGTLKRADQRDLLLFKKSSHKKTSLNILSSSPRRSFHIAQVLKWSLPFETETILFKDIRGNILTRVKKFVADDQSDGLIVAKAAIDRLLDPYFSKFEEFKPMQNELRSLINSLDFQILPLSENPTAAAQGGLAIEIKKNRTSIAELIKKINIETDYFNCQHERTVLSEYGGGCHQKIGLSCISVEGNQFFFGSGQTENNQKLYFRTKLKSDVYKFAPYQILSSKDLWEKNIRNKIELDIKPHWHQPIYITKTFAFDNEHSIKQLKSNFICTAGVQTWKSLARKGLWIHGTSDSLGTSHLPEINSWISTYFELNTNKWLKLSFEENPTNLAQISENNTKLISLPTYSLKLRPIANFDSSSLRMIYWRSGYEFTEALKYWPQIKNLLHACGTGQSYKTICSQIPKNQVSAYYDENDWKSHVL